MAGNSLIQGILSKSLSNAYLEIYLKVFIIVLSITFNHFSTYPLFSALHKSTSSINLTCSFSTEIIPIIFSFLNSS